MSSSNSATKKKKKGGAAPFTIWFKRFPNRVDGQLTINSTKGENIFTRLHARSGQEGWTKTNWTSSKSPIPYSKDVKGDLRLWLRPRQKDQWAGATGIGEFWPISSQDGDDIFIWSLDGKQSRKVIGGHPENKFKGSAGCVVLVCDTPATKKIAEEVSKFLEDLMLEYDYVPMKVI